MSIQRLMAGEFFKLRKRMMTWILAAIIVGLIILLYSILWSICGRAGGYFDRDLGRRVQYEELRRGIFLQAGVPFALQIIAQFGSLLAVIFAAGAAGSEYSWGTVRLMATASSGRLRLITARLIVVCILVALGTLLAVAVALAYSAVITAYYGGADFSFITSEFLREQSLSWLRTVYVMAPLVALAFAAAVDRALDACRGRRGTGCVVPRTADRQPDAAGRPALGERPELPDLRESQRRAGAEQASGGAARVQLRAVEARPGAAGGLLAGSGGDHAGAVHGRVPPGGVHRVPAARHHVGEHGVATRGSANGLPSLYSRVPDTRATRSGHGGQVERGRAVYRERVRFGGQIVRGPIVDAAEDDGAADAVVDALDGIGSRVFNSVDDAKAFLVSQGLVED